VTQAEPKLALVTGGFQRLGGHIAGRLAKAGYDLALHANQNLTADKKLTKILQETAVRHHGFAMDFERPDAAELLLSDVQAHFGRAPDLLVNNASLFQHDDAASYSAQSLQRHLKINMEVPTSLTLALAKGGNERGMDQQGAGDINVVNIVDQRIRNPTADQLSYSLSKQALAESIRTLAVACAGSLRVNGVAPGLTLPTADYTTAQMDRLTQKMPLGRLSSPNDIADAVLYFAGALTVTGQILFVDGGAHMQSYGRDFVFLET